MEEWNSGIVEKKIQTIIPIFHHSKDFIMVNNIRT